MNKKISNKTKDIPIAVSVLAAEIARKERELREKNGIRMSLGAIVSEAVINAYKNKR